VKDKRFHEGVYRWAKIISDSQPPNGGKGAYAEQYGRCIHFLSRAGRDPRDKTLVEQAHALAQEAVKALYAKGMFQGYPETGLYESVDGVGYLFLALLCLDADREIEMQGFGF
jgi:hypothetical protein